MRVSVLIPTYNRVAMLREAIESVQGQTYRDFEIVVVDDGSTDGTHDMLLDMANQFENVRYVWQCHSGVSVARNRAVAEARGELISWLDSDDLYAPTKLEKQVGYLDAHPECQIVCCLFDPFTKMDQDALTPRQQRMMSADYPVCHATACIRKELYDLCGGYDERYTYLEDSEWMARLAAYGVNLTHCIPKKLYRRQIHNGQMTLEHPPYGKKETLRLYADAIHKFRNR